MTAVLLALVAALALALIALATANLRYRTRRPQRIPATATRRILFPFVAYALSPHALDAALRLANAEDATLVPVFLARVPLHLPLDAPLPGSPGARSRYKRRSSIARKRSGSSSTPGSSAGAPTATHSDKRSPTSASTGS
ncbi:MAG: hypothetical protein WBP81_12085 [Solirubrobacteraceae bacterium]